MESSEALRSRLLAEPPDPAKRALDQFYTISRIVITKYTLVRAALALAGTGAVLSVVSVLIDAALP